MMCCSLTKVEGELIPLLFIVKADVEAAKIAEIATKKRIIELGRNIDVDGDVNVNVFGY